MKKSEGRGGKPGETLQIAILTLFMTGGGCRQVEDHKLAAPPNPRNNQNREMWSLKTRAEEAPKTQANLSLREMVESNLGPIQNNLRSMPQTTRIAARSGESVEHRQSLLLKDAALQEVFDFIGRVRTENQSVKVSVLNVNRASRAADDDKWTVTLTFQLFTTRDSALPGERPGQKAEAETEADAKAQAQAEALVPEEGKDKEVERGNRLSGAHGLGPYFVPVVDALEEIDRALEECRTPHRLDTLDLKLRTRSVKGRIAAEASSSVSVTCSQQGLGTQLQKLFGRTGGIFSAEASENASGTGASRSYRVFLRLTPQDRYLNDPRR